MTAEERILAEIDGTKIVENALAYAASKTGAATADQALSDMRSGNVESYLYFRYVLAKETAREVASICDEVESAFLLLENRCEEFPFEPVLLGLVVPRSTAALQALVESTCESVKREVARRIPELASFQCIINAQIIDSESLSARTGLAVLLGSINEPPIQVWPQ